MTPTRPTVATQVALLEECLAFYDGNRTRFAREVLLLEDGSLVRKWLRGQHRMSVRTERMLRRWLAGQRRRRS